MSSDARGCGAAPSSRSTSARHARTRLRHVGHADTVAASRLPVTANSVETSAAPSTTSSPSSSSTTRSALSFTAADGSVTPNPHPGAPMRAVTVIDGDLAWREHMDPEPGTRELLIAVRAAGLNGADMIQRRGLYAAPPDAPADIPGLELAGEVVATGPGVEHFAVGDRVMAVVGGGGQAELALVHERTALRVPDAISWPEAGGFPEVFTTPP